MTVMMPRDPAGLDTLVQILRHRADRQPDRHAFSFLPDGENEADRISYGELDRQARAVAARLQADRAAGEPVLLVYPTGLEFISAFFGCLYAGAFAVPLYPPHPNRPPAHLAAVARDTGARLALTTDALAGRVRDCLSRTPEAVSLEWVATDRLDGFERWADPGIRAEQVAFLQYTSGSTAAPKGVMVTHRNLMHNEGMIRAATGNTPESVGVGWLPLYHDMGLIGNVLQPVYTGFPCILMPPAAFLQKPVRWVQAVSRFRGTMSGGPDFAYALCAGRAAPEDLTGVDLSCWHVAVNAAEPIRAETLDRFAAAFAPYGFRPDVFFPSYGLAEATLMSAGPPVRRPPLVAAVSAHALATNHAVPGEDTASRRIVSSGQPWLGQEVVIVEPDSRTRCPAGRVGEIWVAGASVASGYWKQPRATEATFHARTADTGEGPFLRTGDLGFVLDGELYVTGRLKDVLIVRGQNVYPQDVERGVERSHPAARPDGCAVAQCEVQGEDRVVVFLEVERAARRTNPEEIFQAVREELAGHGLAAHALVLLLPGGLPKTTSGKLRRGACWSEYLAGALKVVAVSQADFGSSRSGTAEATPRGDTPSTIEPRATATGWEVTGSATLRLRQLEAYLARELAKLLGRPVAALDPGVGLYSLGVDSLTGAQLLQRAAEGTGVGLPVEAVLQNPTLERLAALLAARLTNRVEPASPNVCPDPTDAVFEEGRL